MTFPFLRSGLSDSSLNPARNTQQLQQPGLFWRFIPRPISNPRAINR